MYEVLGTDSESTRRMTGVESGPVLISLALQDESTSELLRTSPVLFRRRLGRVWCVSEVMYHGQCCLNWDRRG